MIQNYVSLQLWLVSQDILCCSCLTLLCYCRNSGSRALAGCTGMTSHTGLAGWRPTCFGLCVPAFSRRLAWTPLPDYLGPLCVQKRARVNRQTPGKLFLECLLLMHHSLAKTTHISKLRVKGWKKGHLLQAGLAKNSGLLSFCILPQVHLYFWVGKGGPPFPYLHGSLRDNCSCNFLQNKEINGGPVWQCA